MPIGTIANGESSASARAKLNLGLVAIDALGAPTTIGKAILNLTNPGAVTFLRMNADNTPSALSASDLRTALGLESVSPIILSVKNITVLTSGAPADIASISVPPWVTRWMLVGSSVGATSRLIAESASGPLSAATFAVLDGAGGVGNFVSSGTITGPSSANLGSLIGAAAPGTLAFSTSSTIYIRQTANSANAGTCSFYLVVFPFL